MATGSMECVNRSHALGFVFGLSVSIFLTMCVESGAESDTTASLDDLESRLAELESAVGALDPRVAGLETVAEELEPRVAGLETVAEELEPRVLDVEAAASANVIAWQRKALTAGLAANTTGIAELAFSNLAVGKTYRLSMSAQLEGGASDAILHAIHDGNTIAQVKSQSRDASGEIEIQGQIAVFTATATTLTFDYSESASGGFLRTPFTYVILEELAVHVATTKWD